MMIKENFGENRSQRGAHGNSVILFIKKTSILLYERDTGHPVCPHDFNVLSSSTNSFELLMRETLLIRKFNPSLNANLGSFPLSLF